jgi:hypothetical protein
MTSSAEASRAAVSTAARVCGATAGKSTLTTRVFWPAV